MPISAFALKVLALSETIYRWLAMLSGLDRANRERVADYADQIAATLARAEAALARISAHPTERAARADARRELGRISGYVEDMVGVLDDHLDGRKLAGVKRRLEALDARGIARAVAGEAAGFRSGAECARLNAAEGYFRALADGLRT